MCFTRALISGFERNVLYEVEALSLYFINGNEDEVRL